MAIINDLKNLINTSGLFVEQEKLAAHEEGNNEKPKKRKRRSNRGMVKIGQGGTLDPLAGELGQISASVLIFLIYYARRRAR